MKLPNCRFKFDKSTQLFIRMHNETLSVVAMRISNEDSPMYCGKSGARSRRKVARVRNFEMRIGFGLSRHRVVASVYHIRS